MTLYKKINLIFSPEYLIHKYFYLIIIVTSFIVAGSSIVSMGFDFNHVAKYLDMIDGSAQRPFVTRALIPQTIHLISDITPETVKNEINNFPERSGLASFITSEAEDHHNTYYQNAKAFICANRFYDYTIGAIIVYLSIFLFIIVFRKLLKTVYVASNLFYDLTAIIAQLLVTTCFIEGHYIYDFPSLFFSVLFVYLMLNEKWSLLLLQFTFFAFHKETSIFFIILFVLMWYYKRNIEKKKFALITIYFCSIYIFARILYNIIFHNNFGESLELHLIHNIMFFMTKLDISNAISYLVIFFLIFYKWSLKPASIKLYFFMSFGLALMACCSDWSTN